MGFDDFDFDSDAAWVAYIKNIELTGDQTAQSAQLKRLQAKWFKKNVDPDFELPAQQPAASSTSTSTQAAPPDAPAPEPTASSTTADAPPTSSPPRQPPAQAYAAARRESMLPGLNALIHIAMTVLAAVFLVTFVMQSQEIYLKAYRFFMQAALMSHLLRIITTVGYPKLWPFNWRELQLWITKVSGTSDAHYASVCFMFATQPPTLAVMVSPLLFACLRLAAYTRNNYETKLPFLMPLCNRVYAKKEQAFYLMAVVDITLLAVLIGRAFTHRAFLFPLVYVNMLRTRYNAPVSARYHQPVWATITSYVKPVLQHMPTPVHSAVGWVVRWFTGRQAV